MPINKISFKETLQSYMRNPFSMLLLVLVLLATAATLGIFLYIIGYILVQGVPYITPSLFALNYTSDNVSLFPAIVATLEMIVLALALAGPIGIFTAIYLVEYAKRGSKFVELIALTTETLSGIPSIVYGLFGMLFFVTYTKLGLSLISGTLTISIMILPLIIRSSEEALKAVNDTYREASFGLGAGKLRTVFRIVLPSALNGILAGIILSVGRIIGETAALIYTAGTVAQIPLHLSDSGRTLAVHMYLLSSESLHTEQAYATAVVLLVIVCGINVLSNMVGKRFGKESAV